MNTKHQIKSYRTAKDGKRFTQWCDRPTSEAKAERDALIAQGKKAFMRKLCDGMHRVWVLV
jgi:hypothetical protein